MRLIDADALKEIIGECQENWIDSPEEIAESNMWHRIMNDIDSTPTVGGWISVEDRLPMLIESVLFTGKNAHGSPFLTQRGYFDGRFWHSDSIGTIYAATPVTHWMPLPKPPEVYE